MLVRAFLFVWLLVAGIGLVIYLFRSSLGFFALVTGGFLGAIILYATFRERIRRKREGYYVYKRGGAEDGVLFYCEQGRELQFYFDRRTDTIYIPSDVKWRQTMPAWAQNYKQQVVDRIKQCVGKRLIGKSWSYEETNDDKQIVPMEMQGHSPTRNSA
jgi:hypothetical protein